MAIHTHIISGYARPIGRSNRYRAECGALVDGKWHARDGQPSCPDCARLAKEDAETSRMLSQLQSVTEAQAAAHFGGPPVKTTLGDTLAGYRLKGRTR